MAEPGDSNNRMDLSLNLGPPSPSRLSLALGLGSSSNEPTHGVRGSIREPVLPRFELVNYYPGNHDLDPPTPEVSSAENGEPVDDDDALQELLRRPEVRRFRSNQARHRWRRHVRRIRPTILDSDELHHPFHVFRRNESVSPLFIFRTVDGNGRGPVDANHDTTTTTTTTNNNNNNNNPETDGNNPEMPAETLGAHKESVESLQTVETTREADESSSNVTNFECNICLDMAREPVVTSCGHLFCWDCLYLWLHVHSNTKECPVCKGEVTEMNITPIYGRGNGNAPETESKIGEHGEKVPPRPHARRIESLRQRVGRPISRRVVEAIRLSRRHGAEEGHDESRVGVQEGEMGTGREDEGVEDLLGAAADQILNRLRVAQRLQRESVEERWRMRQRIFGRRSSLFRSPSAESRTAPVNPHFAGDDVEERMRAGAIAREGDDAWGHVPFTRLQRSDRLAAIRARLASMEGMLETLASTNNNAGQPGASAPSNPSNSSVSVRHEFIPEQGVQGVTGGIVVVEERASVSSTNAVIQTEGRSGDAVLEQESVRSSPQRRRHAASGSLDVDGGLLHARKRRRLN